MLIVRQTSNPIRTAPAVRLGDLFEADRARGLLDGYKPQSHTQEPSKGRGG